MSSGIVDVVEQPFFSIIIPVFNGDTTIHRCLNSILNQHFKNYEVLIIDSLSADRTVEIINEFIRTSASIKLHSIKSGIYEAMNYGIRVSTGKYLYFMGCDDVFFNSHVLNDVSLAIQRTENPHILYGNVLMGDGTRLHDGIFNLAKLYHWNICHQSIFYSKTVFDIVGFYDLTFPVHADWHFNFRCFAAKQLAIVYINHLIAVYAVNGFSGKNVDSLKANRKEIFMSIAKKADRKEYLRLKIDTNQTTGLPSKIKYIYYVLLFGIVLLFKKVIK